MKPSEQSSTSNKNYFGNDTINLNNNLMKNRKHAFPDKTDSTKYNGKNY